MLHKVVVLKLSLEMLFKNAVSRRGWLAFFKEKNMLNVWTTNVGDGLKHQPYEENHSKHGHIQTQNKRRTQLSTSCSLNNASSTGTQTPDIHNDDTTKHLTGVAACTSVDLA